MRYANNVGVAARYDLNYDIAIEYYLKSLRRAEKEQNKKNIAMSSNGIGIVFSNIPGREEEAKGYFLKALASERQINDSLGIAMNLLSISNYYINIRDYRQAKLYLDTLLKINELRNDQFGIAITYQQNGYLFYEEGKDLKKSEEYYLDALVRFRQLKNKGKEASLLYNIGALYDKVGNDKDALSYYSESLELSMKIGHIALVVENSYGISKIKESRKEYSEALHYYKMGKEYEDSIVLSEQKIKIASLIYQYQIEQKEAKISSLEEESIHSADLIELQEARIRNHRTSLIVLLISAILIFTIAYSQYRFKEAKKKAQKSLQEKNQELLKAHYEKSIAQAKMIAARAQLNPHFLFNSLNAINLLIQKNENKKAGRYLVTLTRFYRMILELPKSHLIPLEEEMELIKHYISLEEKRFDNDFQFKLQVLPKEEMLNIKIPPLLLQPFVENAVWHGLLPSQKPNKELAISVEKRDADIVIIIEDNGVGRGTNISDPANNDQKKRRMGMKITEERIAEFNKSYNHKMELAIEDKIGEDKMKLGTKVELYLKNCNVGPLINKGIIDHEYSNS